MALAPEAFWPFEEDDQQALDRFLTADFDFPEEEEAPAPPVVADPARADFALRKLRQLEQRRNRAKAAAAANKAGIDAWLSAEQETIDRQARWLSLGLESYARAELAATRTKTVKLPNGELRLRAGVPRIVVDEDPLVQAAAVARLAELDPSLVKVERSVRKRELAAEVKHGGAVRALEWVPTGDGREQALVVDSDGSAVPGVVVERPDHDVFTAAPEVAK